MINRSAWLNVGYLYVITDTNLGRGSSLVDAVDAAIRGGASLVQYRDKSGSPQVRLQEAQVLATLCQHHRVPLIINDDVELAANIPGTGVHLGVDDADYAEARLALPDRILGVSCYNSLAGALKAAALGVDYVAFGSIFPSATKPTAVRASLDLLRQARQKVSVPIVAIGGITPENAGSVIGAGADMIAVISGVFSTPDPEHAARRYVDSLTRNK